MKTTAKKVRITDLGVILHQPKRFSISRVMEKITRKCTIHSTHESFALLESKQSSAAVGSAVIRPLSSISQRMMLSICCPETVRKIAAAIRTAVVMSTK